MRSMTGFGLGEAPLHGGRVIVEIRGVNSRFLDLRVRMPPQLSGLTMFVEQAARERLARGRYEVGVRTEGGVLPPPELDRKRAEAAYRALLELRDELAPEAEVPFTMLTAVPDLFSSSLDESLDETRASLTQAIAAAIAAMDQMREREGETLAKDFAARIATVRELGRTIAERAPEVVEAYRRRLKERLERLLASLPGTEPLDPSRLEQEVLLFADRSDITEELTRLESHLSQFESYLSDAQPVGRRLDFLLQELVREIHTVGSKSQDAARAHTVVEMKAEIERMREQVQNVE